MTTPKPKKIRKPPMQSQVIARVSDAQRETWDRLGAAEWLRAMLDALQKRTDTA